MITCLISPRAIRLHLHTLETLRRHLGGERGTGWELNHVDALTEVNQLQAATVSVKDRRYVVSIRHRRASTNTYIGVTTRFKRTLPSTEFHQYHATVCKAMHSTLCFKKWRPFTFKYNL